MADSKVSEQELKNITCCFTGHRPERLNLSERKAKELLRKAVKQAISDSFTNFISGMARGIDMWAAEIVIEEKKNNDDIKLICASPYKGFEQRWSFAEQKRYNDILALADSVKYVCKRYVPSCFQTRNVHMVDRSNLVIAVFNGQKGGTKNTIDYAQRKNVRVINVIR